MIFSIIFVLVKRHCHTPIAYMYSYSYIIPCCKGSVKAFRRQSVCFRVHNRSRIVKERAHGFSFGVYLRTCYKRYERAVSQRSSYIVVVSFILHLFNSPYTARCPCCRGYATISIFRRLTVPHVSYGIRRDTSQAILIPLFPVGCRAVPVVRCAISISRKLTFVNPFFEKNQKNFLALSLLRAYNVVNLQEQR